MKTQGTTGLSGNPLLLQSSQPIQQANTISTLQPTGAPIPHQNVQVWTSSPSGPIGVPGLVPPRGNANLVTLPPGQTVLMTNLVTTNNNPTIPMPVSSPITRPQVHGPQMVHAGNTVVFTSTASTIGDSMPSQLPTSTVIQGPNGPISVALPGGLLPNASVGSLTTAPTAFVSTNPGTLNHDSTAQIPQFIDASGTGQTQFSANTGFQSMVPGTPLVLDPNSVGLSNANTQPKVVGMTTVRSQTFVPPVSQQQVTRPYFPAPTPPPDVTNSGITFSSTDSSQPDATPTSSVTTPCSTEGSTLLQSASATCSTISNTVSTASSNPLVVMSQGTVSTSTTQLPSAPVSVNSPSNPSNPSSHNSSQTIQNNKESPSDTKISVFTPASLGQLMADLDQQLQLDPDAQEVLVNLANEFVTSVAEKAQKLASHRNSSVVDAKDVHYCLERHWNITIPGYVSNDISPRRMAVTEAHKQRLALIKKQIKKM